MADVTATRCPSARLLEQGIPAKLEEVSDCPIESSDFQDFREGVLECLNHVKEYLESEPALTIDDWPLIAVLLAHEDPIAPYTSEACCTRAKELIDRITITEELVEKVFSVIKPRLSEETWQFHIGERYILKSICKRMPNPKQQLNLITNIGRSHLPENQRIAAVCLSYLAQALPVHDGGEGTVANAILDALIRLTRGRETEILRHAFEGIHVLLFSAKCCHSRRSQIYRDVLRNSAMAIALEEKLLYAQVLKRFVASLKLAAREYTNATLDVIEYWTSVAPTRYDALTVLHLMLREGVVTESWQRVAKILLDCAMSCSPEDGCVELVGSCRENLRKIRSSGESEAERQVFARLLRKDQIADREGEPCSETAR